MNIMFSHEWWPPGVHALCRIRQLVLPPRWANLATWLPVTLRDPAGDGHVAIGSSDQFQTLFGGTGHKVQPVLPAMVLWQSTQLRRHADAYGS